MDMAESKSPDRNSSRYIPLDVQLAIDGDPEAYDRIVRPLLGSLLALARRLAPSGTGEELLQESLIRGYRGISRFRGDSSFRSWMVSILYHLAKDPRKFLGPKPIPAGPLCEIPSCLEGDPFQRVSAQETLRKVEQVMERLPLRLRTALHLRAVEGWSYKEISASMGCSRGSVRNAVLAARRKLREKFEDKK
ncbi:MAG TPA: RNA polymerase sigma factor [Planctomycetes bacterium]|nr:RNA polymerase sigma factor [Planctomycetota bacterium]